MKNRSIFSALAILFFLAGCGTAPKIDATQRELSGKDETYLAARLDQRLLKAFGKWEHPAVSGFIDHLLKTLLASDGAYQEEMKGVHIRLLRTKTPYIMPGLAKTIYISRGIFDFIDYENELAFVLGSQLALLKEHAVAHSLTRDQKVESMIEGDWFEPGGLFDFGSDVYLKAEAKGIRLAYGAKYDPRGAITLIQRWTTSPASFQLRALGKIMPEPEERLTMAREEVAKLSPLRDPIVKSLAFDRMKKALNAGKNVEKAESKNAIKGKN